MEFIAQALTALSKSGQELVALLYGFDGPRHTPREIAAQRGLSLAQVEKTALKAIRQMRHPARSGFIRDALAAGDGRIWSAIGGAAGILYKTESPPQAAARLPGHLLFAIECLHGDLEGWLAGNARATDKAWYRSRFTVEEIERLGQALDDKLAELRLPATSESVAHALNVEVEALETAVHLSAGFRTYLGYVGAMPIGTRTPRAIRLHRLLSGPLADQCISTRRLLAEYLAAYGGDACTGPDAQRALFSYPHLFLQAGDVGWYGIGPAGIAAPGPDGFADDDVPFPRWNEKRKALKADSGPILIRRVLLEHGQLPVQQIQRLTVKRSDGKIPSAAVSIYLNADAEFIRFAPGIYGLAKHLSAAGPLPPSKALLTRKHCLEYIYARWAGEPADTYPLWTPGMEAEWCEWAQVKERDLLGSLLAVVEPSSWPSPDSYKEIWLWKKECLGYYGLEKPLPLPLAGVPLIDLLAMVKCARSRGSASWILANRVAGNRETAATLMALLIAAGAILPASHWQMPHAVAPGAQEIDAMLSAELHRNGSLPWNGAAGEAMLERLTHGIDRGETGWAAGAGLPLLLDRLRNPEPTPTVPNLTTLSPAAATEL